MIDPEIRKESERIYAKMLELYRSGELPADSFYKCAVCIASEYLNADELAEGMRILFTCPQGYFETTMEQQMQDDPEFASVGNAVYDALDRHGLFVSETDLVPTQSMGLA